MSEREAVEEPAAIEGGSLEAGVSGGQTRLQTLLLAALCLGSGAVAGRISTLLSTVVIGLGINLISQVVAQLNFSRAERRHRLVDGAVSPGDIAGSDAEVPLSETNVVRSRPRQLIAIVLIVMTVLGLLLGRATESGGFGLDMSSTTTTTTESEGGSTSSTSSSTTSTTVSVSAVEVIAPETLKVGHQNELFTKVPPGAQTEYVLEGQRYPAVVKDFWIRPEAPGTYALQVIVTDNVGQKIFDETLEFVAVEGTISDRTCNRFLRSEISDLVGVDTLLDSSFSSLGLNSCIWGVADQPTQALSMAIHEGVSSDAMVAWLETTTAAAVEVQGADRAWTLAEGGVVRVLAVKDTSFVDVTVGDPLPVDDPLVVASDVAAFALDRVVSGERPPSLACQLFTAEEVSLLARVDVVQMPPELPTSCSYRATGAQIEIQFNEGPVDLDGIAVAAGLESSASTEDEVAGLPAVVLKVEGGFVTAIGLNTETESLVVIVAILNGGENQKSSEEVARELMEAAVARG